MLVPTADLTVVLFVETLLLNKIYLYSVHESIVESRWERRNNPVNV